MGSNSHWQYLENSLPIAALQNTVDQAKLSGTNLADQRRFPTEGSDDQMQTKSFEITY